MQYVGEVVEPCSALVAEFLFAKLDGMLLGDVTTLDQAALRQRFEAHNAAVRALIPAEQLLVYQVKEGWAPLCQFLDCPLPVEPFPRTNDRGEFWDKVSGAK